MARRPLLRRSRLVSLGALLLLASLASTGCERVDATLFSLRRALRELRHPPPEMPADIEVTRNLPFARFGGAPGTLRLDVYHYREREQGRQPVILFLHGGGWVYGSKDRAAVLGVHEMTRHGYAVVSAEYRLTQYARFPAQLHDAKAAVRWIRANAAAYGFDPERIAAWGPSSGGHLASMLGTTGGDPELEGRVGEAATLALSSQVAAVVNFYGISDLARWPEESRISVQQRDAATMVALLLGARVEERPEAARRASPVEHVDPSDAPFLHIHGDADSVVGIAQSLRFHARLEEAGVETTLEIVRGGAHGHEGAFDERVGLHAKARAFLDRHLMAEAPAPRRGGASPR